MTGSHTHGNGIRAGRLVITTILNFTITLAEIIGGIISGSLSLISDALHNLSDGIAVLLAYFAHQISKRPSDEKKTFGYKRTEILAAFINGMILAGVSIYLFYEAVLRLINPEPVKGIIMLVVAAIGLLANFVAVWLLHKDSSRNINVRAAYLHLLSDTLSSVAVIIGGVLIILFDIYWIDPVITILIGLYILKETWQIIHRAINILMQATPAGIDLQQLKLDLEAIPGISNIHHIHAWNLDDLSIHFECHVDLLEDQVISETEKIYNRMDKLLQEKYGVAHITIQFEHRWCDDNEMIHQ